jgi:hypothetical protein
MGGPLDSTCGGCLSRIALSEMRFVIEETPRGLSVTIPTPRNIFALLFLPVWFVGWALGEVSALRSLSGGGGKGPGSFLLVWLAFWTLGGVWAVLTFLRMLVGKERLELDGKVIRVRHEVFGIGPSKEYELRHVRGLRLANTGQVPIAWRAFAPGQGTIAFDYAAKTIRLGDGLEEAEAKQIISRLQQRYRFPSSASAV